MCYFVVALLPALTIRYAVIFRSQSRGENISLCFVGFVSLLTDNGAWGSLVVKALRLPGLIPVVSLDFSATYSFRLTMVLESTKPLVKVSTRNIPAGKGVRYVRLTTSPPSCAECHENLGA